MPSPKREYICETCKNTAIERQDKFNKLVISNGLYECASCRMKRKKAITKARNESPEGKAYRRSMQYVTVTCPECHEEREIRKYGNLNRLCKTCATRKTGKLIPKNKKPKPVKPKPVKKPTKTKQIIKTKPKKKILSKEEKISLKAQLIKKREENIQKITTESEHIRSGENRELNEMEKAAIDAFIAKNGVTKIEPAFQVTDKSQTGSYMNIG